MAVKPILFNTDMVRAILDGRKTVTRRVVMPQPPTGASVIKRASDMWMWKFADFDKDIKPPYQPGDYMYVRETWREYNGKYYYKADECHDYDDYFTKKLPSAPKWRPSIFMPKEAARIWLCVTKLSVEKIKDITECEAHREGFASRQDFISAILKMYPDCTEDSWVWVIEFERAAKPERD